MPLAKTKTYINCKRCGKEIEKKGPREYCIKCRKIIDRELQTKYRNELREMKIEAGLLKRSQN